jgi:hypothetical protein
MGTTFQKKIPLVAVNRNPSRRIHRTRSAILMGRPCIAMNRRHPARSRAPNVSTSLRDLLHMEPRRVVAHAWTTAATLFETARDPWDLLRTIVRERKRASSTRPSPWLRECVSDALRSA